MQCLLLALESEKDLPHMLQEYGFSPLQGNTRFILKREIPTHYFRVTFWTLREQ
jgi:hypothetical protein